MLKVSEIITQQPKTLEIPNIVDIKSVFIEHPETENVENVSVESGAGKNSNSPLYSETKKVNIIWMQKKKKAKITKWSHACKYLQFLILLLQLKDTEYAIRNKLINLLTESKGFKFVATLDLESKK